MSLEWYNAFHLQCPKCKWRFYAKCKYVDVTRLQDPTCCPMCGHCVTEDNQVKED